MQGQGESSPDHSDHEIDEFLAGILFEINHQQSKPRYLQCRFYDLKADLQTK
jgi:hypothetical protein